MADSGKAPDTVRAGVYLATDEDRVLAKRVLGELDAGERFNGVLEAELEPAQVKSLDEAGLVVSPIDRPGGAPATVHRGWSPEDAEAIEELRERSRTVSISDDALVVGEGSTEEPDPRVHRPGGTTPEVAEALPEDAYNIELEGPITEKQRLDLDALGVDVAAFEPGFGYRTMLTRKQYAAVRELPFVAGVSRYRFSQAVTPELLDLATRDDADRGPELLSADEEAESEPRLFDCLLHREADLEQVEALIENTPGTEVVDRTNLRIRFRATADLPLIAALASLPAVRKLSPYEVPTL